MKKLGRIAGARSPDHRRPQEPNVRYHRRLRSELGWEYTHVAVDDYSRLAYSSCERTCALDGWLWHYNHQRRHSALSHQPPASRTNLLGSYN